MARMLDAFKRDVLETLNTMPARMKAFDEEMRRIVPKCPHCGRPTGGVVFNGQTKETAGLCVCDKKKGDT